jgi:hypothetical protein
VNFGLVPDSEPKFDGIVELGRRRLKLDPIGTSDKDPVNGVADRPQQLVSVTELSCRARRF